VQDSASLKETFGDTSQPLSKDFQAWVSDTNGGGGDVVAAGMKVHADCAAIGVTTGPANSASAPRTTDDSAPATTPGPASSAPPPSTAPPATTAPASCHPLTNGGHCYQPGEDCRNSDHGLSGVAGGGEAITCKDNDGWRWEPA
jgi:hypothetical protein